MPNDTFKFPKGLLWGAATSAHQVEGGNKNDWTEWESSPARVADLVGRNLNPGDYISGEACDHYRRFKSDFNIAKSLDHNAHRFSIEWSRIEPEEGKFSEREIEHYREVIRALRERGIEPFVTLWHWTLPRWFVKKGGWLNSSATGAFTRFAERVANEYKNEVKFWTTLNEPETFARHGYFLGNRPPGQKNFFRAYGVLRRLAQAHQRAYTVIKKVAPQAQVGFAESVVHFEPYNLWPHNLLAMRLLRWWRNNPFLAKFIACSDFIGLNYYFHSRVRLSQKSWRGFQYNENKTVSDIGWEIYPEGIYRVLKNLKKHSKPIYITENGLADAKDEKRTEFIKDHLQWVAKAINEGVNVRGYFHWSLLDNFEWDSGFGPRFGLVEVDYKTRERKIRPSAWVYKEIIERGLPAEVPYQRNEDGEYKKIIEAGFSEVQPPTVRD